ncbi:MAG: hypothetical protein DMG06_08285 [Acidobacteria bacterium]|nr:MAG: hypothetical protein DMG06_08285 [Acidobacteriota bacterium]
METRRINTLSASFRATAGCLSFSRARPLFMQCDYRTFLIDASEFRLALAGPTRSIVSAL